MGDDIPAIVRVRVECEECRPHEDEGFAFEMPRKKAQPREEYVPGRCPECKAPIVMHLKR